ncbi:class F sortase [Streptomyces sp. NPDC088817]|uniref:class F sortase n=1 Tax=unclassified Streptomyces TaxID=2593676 RepID=UPI0038009297
MAPRRRRRRPWYRTRAYRLTRTTVLAVVLVTAGNRCGGQHDGTAPERAAGPGAVAPAHPGPSGADGDGGNGDGGNGGNGGRAANSGPDRSGSGTDGSNGDGPDRGKSASPRPGASSSPPPTPLPRSPATTLRIPSLGVDAPIIRVGLDGDRELQTPPVDKPKLVGWYDRGPTPGEPGTAVAVGHRDTRTGGAVFAGLGRLGPGHRIEIRRQDGRTAVYTVDKVRVFDKARFPDKEVYGTSRRPELRVITCGGLYTHRAGYSSNVVVFAHLTSTT